ncbi:hypothetical protein OWV82_020208 [Melia azedarach]|uniref:Uncharacterized protein n=1 Tax=Melia azedarach TaxID=155640 RepID=A0ACC1X570_MELAZ|nr:hypothetical protein OWV82_020208 [Melia azedarach]
MTEQGETIPLLSNLERTAENPSIIASRNANRKLVASATFCVYLVETCSFAIAKDESSASHYRILVVL